MSLLFVSMSDLHLGEEDSVLTNLSLGKAVPEPNGPGPCMVALVNYLHGLKGTLTQGLDKVSISYQTPKAMIMIAR